MKEKKCEATNPLVEFHRPHKFFGLRTEQELKRAERYCEFLSLMVIDISSLSKFVQKKNITEQRLKELEGNLESIVRKNVRETDIVSKFEKNRLALLLSETPKEGANCVCGRLEEEIRAYASDIFKTPQDWKAHIEIVSFPDKENGRERFLAFAQRYEIG
ncbi:MAG: diguanylate cyclase [candidate division Zixibacteria bacterium]|nr:diguanylate cyclase [candidate division Zixibacteria bacterium]